MPRAQQAFSGPRPVAKTIAHVLKPALRKRSSSEAAIILDWVKIITPELAQRCYPERLILPRGQKEAGTLVIAADSSSSLLIQYSESLLIDRINSYFGYQVVEKIKIKHTQIPFKKKEKNILQAIAPAIYEDDPAFQGIKDDELRTAMMRFKESYDLYAIRTRP